MVRWMLSAGSLAAVLAVGCGRDDAEPNDADRSDQSDSDDAESATESSDEGAATDGESATDDATDGEDTTDGASERPADAVAPIDDITVVAGNCDELQPAVAPMRRLTRLEYNNTVRDLLGVDVDVSDLLSADEVTGGFESNTVGAITELDVTNYLDAAGVIANTVVSSNLGDLLPCESADGDTACASAFIQDIAPKAFRRPLEDEEADGLLQVYEEAAQDGDFQSGIRGVLTALLFSPSFVYRAEVRGTPQADESAVLLSDYEMASRLSYLLWQTMPDQTLFDVAAAGDLNTPEELRTQTQRMLEDPRSRNALVGFFTQWLDVAGVETLTKDLTPPSSTGPSDELLQLLSDSDGWLDTGPDNGLSEDAAIFSQSSDPSPRLSTSSTGVNIHSHYVANDGEFDLGDSPRFDFTGRMLLDDDAGGIGITVLSDYPNADTYYRLRRLPDGGAFHFAPHGTGCDGYSTGVIPEPNTFYAFRVSVEVSDQQTLVQARVWEDGTGEPEDPQITCIDETDGRRATGTVGLWSMAAGTKTWDRLELDLAPAAQLEAPDFGPVAASMQAETHAFIEHVLWEDDGSLQTLLTANYSFLDENTAAIYGIDDVSGSALQRVELPGDERRGILTQPSVLAVHAKPNQTSPVLRGAFVRERLLCQLLPPPPDDVIVAAPDPDPDLTTRERFAAHSEDPSCSGCHALMDGIGLGFENYDAVGRYRVEENGMPINAAGEIVGTTDLDGEFDGVVELAGLLAQSEQVRTCAATQWYRFAMGRPETEADGCSLVQGIQHCNEGRCDIAELVETVVLSDAFRYTLSNE